MTLQEEIREIQEYNQGWKELYAQKYMGKKYNELSKQERLDIDDLIKQDNE